jgi:hypothetical protein
MIAGFDAPATFICSQTHTAQAKLRDSQHTTNGIKRKKKDKKRKERKKGKKRKEEKASKSRSTREIAPRTALNARSTASTNGLRPVMVTSGATLRVTLLRSMSELVTAQLQLKQAAVSGQPGRPILAISTDAEPILRPALMPACTTQPQPSTHTDAR